VVKASYPLANFPEEPFPKEGLVLLEGTKNFLVRQGLAKNDFSIEDWKAK
jgi:sulfonate transport system substrate-binding protein